MECNRSLVWVVPNDLVELDETEDSQVVPSTNGLDWLEWLGKHSFPVRPLKCHKLYAVRNGIYPAAASAETSASSSSQGGENANHGNSKKRNEANLDNVTLNWMSMGHTKLVQDHAGRSQSDARKKSQVTCAMFLACPKHELLTCLPTHVYRQGPYMTGRFVSHFKAPRANLQSHLPASVYTSMWKQWCPRICWLGWR